MKWIAFAILLLASGAVVYFGHASWILIVIGMFFLALVALIAYAAYMRLRVGRKASGAAASPAGGAAAGGKDKKEEHHTDNTAGHESKRGSGKDALKRFFVAAFWTLLVIVGVVAAQGFLWPIVLWFWGMVHTQDIVVSHDEAVRGIGTVATAAATPAASYVPVSDPAERARVQAPLTPVWAPKEALTDWMDQAPVKTDGSTVDDSYTLVVGPYPGSGVITMRCSESLTKPSFDDTGYAWEPGKPCIGAHWFRYQAGSMMQGPVRVERHWAYNAPHV